MSDPDPNLPMGATVEQICGVEPTKMTFRRGGFTPVEPDDDEEDFNDFYEPENSPRNDN